MEHAIVETTTSSMVRLLQKTFPHIHGIKSPEKDTIFLGNCAEGGEIDGLPACDSYPEVFMANMYINGVHEDLHELLDEHGWYAEPYDSGTWFAYRQ